MLLTIEFANILPKTLTSLHVGCIPTIITERHINSDKSVMQSKQKLLCDALPPSLTELSLNFFTYKFDILDLTFLRPEVKKITCSEFYRCDGIRFPKELDELSACHLGSIVEKMLVRKLTVKFLSFFIHRVSGLKELRVLSEIYIQKIPPSVEKLSISINGSYKQIKVLELPNLKELELRTPDMGALSRIPKEIIRLHLILDNEKEDFVDSYSYLAEFEKLQYLKITTSHELYHSIFSYIPRSLSCIFIQRVGENVEIYKNIAGVWERSH